MKTNKRGQYLSVVAGVPVGMINNAIKEIAKTRKVLKKRKVGKRKWVMAEKKKEIKDLRKKE